MRLTACLTVAALLLGVAACGGETEELDPISWPFIERPERLTINGKEFMAYIASDEQHRARARNGLALRKGEAIAYLYPKSEKPVKLKFDNLPEDIDLVFVDGNGKVLRVEQVHAFSGEAQFNQTYSQEGTRLVLEFRKGIAAELKLSRGASVKTKPDLIKKAEEAEEAFATLIFIERVRDDRRERPREEGFPSVKLEVLEEAADVARALKDRPDLKEGEGVYIPLGSRMHEFWLKEVPYPVCACYLEQGRFGTTVSALYENIEDEGKSDRDRPVYASPTRASALVLFRGTDYFSANEIERRRGVILRGVSAFRSDLPDLQSLTLKFGKTRLTARVALTHRARLAALGAAAVLKDYEALVFAFDDPTEVGFDAGDLSGETNLLFIETDGKGGYSHGLHKTFKPGEGSIKSDSGTQSRFVIALPRTFKTESKIEFPYELRDLKPYLPAIVFYRADRKKDVVRDRWPTKETNYKARARVELAITSAEQRRGLMFRESLKKNHGMLFIYDEEIEDGLTYWMKNCRMDLSIAFVDTNLQIVKIHSRMKAPAGGATDDELDTYDSVQPAQYAIEMRADWFKDNGIKVGDRVYIPPRLLPDN